MRECGTCNLCCKVVAVDALHKPAGTWCEHAIPGKGCSIYGSHPAECKTFECVWLFTPELDETWKPNTSGIVLLKQDAALFVYVDESHRGAWKKEPYYSVLKHNALAMAAAGARVVIYEGRDATIMFPEEDLFVGEIGKGDNLIAGYISTSMTRQPHVKVETVGGEMFERRGGIYMNR